MMSLRERIANLNIMKRFLNDQIDSAKRRRAFLQKGVTLGLNTSISDDSTIGKYTYIGNYSIVGGATIGRYTSIGDNCTIGPGEHCISNIATSYLIYKDKIGIEYYDGDQGKRSGGVSIGNDVWIGCNTVIRRGVKVGNGAVIGACSYVNKDVPEFAIVGGVPAKIIKYRFDKNKMDIIRDSEWWNSDLDDAKKQIEDLDNMMTSLNAFD